MTEPSSTLQGQYPSNPGGYLPNPGGYPPNPGGYPPNPGGYPPNPGGYPSSPGANPVPYSDNPPDYKSVSKAYPNTQPSNGSLTPDLPSDHSPSDDEGNEDSNDEPNAPPLCELVNLPGYEGLTFDFAALKPPSYEECMSTPTVPREIFQNPPTLTEDEAQDALIRYVSRNCCYGSKAARNMTITDIKFQSAFHCKLESYGEKRETACLFEAYKNDTRILAGGSAPGPWEVNVSSDRGKFTDSKKSVEVPNSSNVRPCHKCNATGHIKCRKCHGRGRTRCTWCHGTGKRSNKRCHSCNGTRYKGCLKCHRSGKVKCRICDGSCQLRYYIKLTVTWKNHVDDEISNTAVIPRHLIRDVSGQTAFEEEQPRVWPISNFPDPKVNVASENLVRKHRDGFPEERILMQRQSVRIVPVAEVNYSWKDRNGSYFVYGYEHKVYFPNYPQSCCWGCQIL